MWDELWLCVGTSVYFVYDHMTSPKEVTLVFGAIIVGSIIMMFVSNFILTIIELLKRQKMDLSGFENLDVEK